MVAAWLKARRTAKLTVLFNLGYTHMATKLLSAALTSAQAHTLLRSMQNAERENTAWMNGSVCCALGLGFNTFLRRSKMLPMLNSMREQSPLIMLGAKIEVEKPLPPLTADERFEALLGVPIPSTLQTAADMAAWQAEKIKQFDAERYQKRRDQKAIKASVGRARSLVDRLIEELLTGTKGARHAAEAFYRLSEHFGAEAALLDATAPRLAKKGKTAAQHAEGGLVTKTDTTSDIHVREHRSISKGLKFNFEISPSKTEEMREIYAKIKGTSILTDESTPLPKALLVVEELCIMLDNTWAARGDVVLSKVGHPYAYLAQWMGGILFAGAVDTFPVVNGVARQCLREVIIRQAYDRLAEDRDYKEDFKRTLQALPYAPCALARVMDKDLPEFYFRLQAHWMQRGVQAY